MSFYNLKLSTGELYKYTIKPSVRAKRLGIKLSARGELTVTLPRNISVKQAHKFVTFKRSWIEKHLSSVPVESIAKIPSQLDLKLLNEVWLIKLIKEQSTRIILEEDSESSIVIKGDVDNIQLVRKVIDLWLKNKSRYTFASMLESIAGRYGFHYNRLSIRAQKTRWGSCSSQRNINLNCKLLLMPKKIVEYVMIHELCHTIEMNHSTRFWALVEKYDPDFRLHKSDLKELEKLISL